ncbi:MAG TPA: thioredoxin-dependent thiol peroxidase [Anaerolineales bacterium]|jgi:peroxiredoxin Q/BCP|nr:thioredoxin-dependent thiol peroxidase [Anaerolineales bacterium]
MTQLKVGDYAPDFVLNDEAGMKHSLAAYQGQPVILYFYPKDDTPGCTTEACNFRDDYSAYEDADVVILGVSADDEASHLKFKEKFDLPFSLLADTNKEVVNKYGVWGKKSMYGKEFEGIHRTTFLIDAEGKIARIFEKVKPSTHSEELLNEIEKLGL